MTCMDIRVHAVSLKLILLTVWSTHYIYIIYIINYYYNIYLKQSQICNHELSAKPSAQEAIAMYIIESFSIPILYYLVTLSYIGSFLPSGERLCLVEVNVQ